MNWLNTSRGQTSFSKSAVRLFLFLISIQCIIMITAKSAVSITLHTRTTPIDGLQLTGDPPYHNGPTLVCDHCHITHSSKQHDSDGNPARLQQSASPVLLKASGVNELCLSCHDGKSGIPDVVNGDSNGLTDRSAGMFSSPGVDTWKGHSLASGERPGSVCDQCHTTGKAELVCTDCHNPHGNNRPRNLRWASNPGSEPQFGLIVNPAASGLAKYESDNVAYATNNSDTLREVSNMCIDCHHQFSGQDAVTGTRGHIRHPSYDSERQSVNNIAQGESKGSSAPDHWAAGSGVGFEIKRVPFLVVGAADFSSAKTVNPQTNGVFCLSCHKAHGSSHAFGMTWDVSGNNSSKACSQCHGM